MPPVTPAVLSVGGIAGGVLNAANAMPAETMLSGTACRFSPSVRDPLERRVGELARGLAALDGARAEVEYRWSTPATLNRGNQARPAIQAATGLVGEAYVDGAIAPVAGKEKFAFMLEARPGDFLFIEGGVGPDGYLSQPAYSRA